MKPLADRSTHYDNKKLMMMLSEQEQLELVVTGEKPVFFECATPSQLAFDFLDRYPELRMLRFTWKPELNRSTQVDYHYVFLDRFFDLAFELIGIHRANSQQVSVSADANHSKELFLERERRAGEILGYSTAEIDEYLRAWSDENQIRRRILTSRD